MTQAKDTPVVEDSGVRVDASRLAALEKFEEDQAKREKYNKARQASIQRLINAHKPQFEQYLEEERAKL